MSDSEQNVADALEYRAARQFARLLPTGLLLIFLGLVIITLADADSKSRGPHVGLAVILAAGCAVIAVALWKRARPGKPVFTLSPAGIQYRIPLVKDFLIPWHDVQGVDSILISQRIWNPFWLFSKYPTALSRVLIHPDVTVVVVPKAFYDETIWVNSFLLRGPGWNASFIPAGTQVQVALHHDLVSVEAAGLRQAVEARWLAYRDRRGAVPAATRIVAMGADPKAMSTWDKCKTAAPLLGIAVMLANLAGVWQLPGQAEGREARAKANAERQYWRDANKRRLDETKQREAEDRARRKELEDTLRRAFGK